MPFTFSKYAPIANEAIPKGFVINNIIICDFNHIVKSSGKDIFDREATSCGRRHIKGQVIV